MAMNNFTQSLKNNWKAIAIGLSPIVILCIVFAIPFKTVPIQFTETYWATEMKREPYTVQETYQDNEPYIVTETNTYTVYDSYTNIYGFSYSFDVKKPGAIVYITTQTSPYYYRPPRLIWYSGDERPFPYPPYYYDYWCCGDWSGQAKVTIKVSYPEEVTKFKTVTKTREVTKYREVPVQVEKERKVTKYVKMSIWQYLFLDEKLKAQTEA